MAACVLSSSPEKSESMGSVWVKFYRGQNRKKKEGQGRVGSRLVQFGSGLT